MILVLASDEFAVLQTLLQFHLDNDKPGLWYEWEPFRRLCKRAGLDPDDPGTIEGGKDA